MRLAGCTYWEYQISLDLDDELAVDGRDALDRHLNGCAHCRGVRETFAAASGVLSSLPDLADPGLLAALHDDIWVKTYRARHKPKRRRLVWPAVAAALLAAFAAANLWLGPLWQRPALVAVTLAPGNCLELIFNQSMDSTSWPGTATVPASAAGRLNAPMTGGPSAGTAAPFAAGGSQTQGAPQMSHAPAMENSPVFGTFSPKAAPAQPTPAPVPSYTVSRQGDQLVVSFAGPLPKGPFQILVPATLRDRWGRKLGRTYLVVIDQGSVAVKTQ